MPRKDNILSLPGFSIKKITDGNPLVIDVHYRRKPRCGHCLGKKVRKKDRFLRQVKHETIGHRCTILRFAAYKLYCRDCQRYSNQRFPGINKHQRASERFRKQIFFQHTEGVSIQALSRNFKIGKATAERWYHHQYTMENNKMKNATCPIVLGIDEHFFSKKHRFATTFCDLKNHKIFDIAKRRSARDLAGYLNQLPGKERVKVVCIDLSANYRNLIRQHFPNAKIVADRFHVIRLVEHMCMQTYQSIDPRIKNNRGLLSILRTKPDKLSPKRLQKLQDYLAEQPSIEAIYQFKQKLHYVLMKKTMTAKRCKKYIPILLNMISELRKSSFKRLATLGKTLKQWQEEIVRMWRFTKSNGITEGFHRKMKLIQRRAYGFRNFENYRLRVKVLCS